jgi:hypothetical protein
LAADGGVGALDVALLLRAGVAAVLRDRSSTIVRGSDNVIGVINMLHTYVPMLTKLLSGRHSKMHRLQGRLAFIAVISLAATAVYYILKKVGTGFGSPRPSDRCFELSNNVFLHLS